MAQWVNIRGSEHTNMTFYGAIESTDGFDLGMSACFFSGTGP
jgi:hypothetical protein